MPTYRMVYGDDEQVVRQTYDGVEVQQEDGWLVLFRGNEAVLRVREEHVQALERLDQQPTGAAAEAGPLTVADLMRPAATSIERDAHLAAAAYLMRQEQDTALVVLDDVATRVPVAVITATDIAQAVADGKDLDEVRISDLAPRAPITVPPGMGVREAAELMVSSRIRHLPVVDGGRLVGMVDIAAACRGLMA